jgi:hypothetical protein
MQLQLRIAKPVAKFGDLRLIPIIQMLPRAKNLHGRNSRLPDSIQPNGVQTMIDKQVRGENVVHSRSVSFRFRVPAAVSRAL